MKNDELVQFAQKAFIICDNKILIIQKSSKDLFQPDKWDVPGGRKQEDETLDEQIIREVKEEVGIDVVPERVFDMWQFSLNKNGKKTTVVAVARFCKMKRNNIKITEDIIATYKWAEINESLLAYDFISPIKQIIENLVKGEYNL